MKKKNYILNFFVLILIISFSTKIKAQSFDIYVLDKKAGTTKRVTSIANAGEFNASWSNNGKKIAHDVVGDPASPFDQSIFVTDLQTGTSTPLIGAEGGTARRLRIGIRWCQDCIEVIDFNFARHRIIRCISLRRNCIGSFDQRQWIDWCIVWQSAFKVKVIAGA